MTSETSGARERVEAREAPESLERTAREQAMRELAALSLEPGSLDRESSVDIWGFH